jgi:hypothetical protein
VRRNQVIAGAHNHEAVCAQPEWASLVGEPILIRRSDPFEGKNRTVVSADVVCADGVLHGINRVILPG